LLDPREDEADGLLRELLEDVAGEGAATGGARALELGNGKVHLRRGRRPGEINQEKYGRK